jgi:hypothetical protein
VQVPAAPAAPAVEPRTYDSVLAETEEPITSSINLINAPLSSEVTISSASQVEPELPATQPAASLVAATTSPIAPSTPPLGQAKFSAQPVSPTDIFHEMAVDLNVKKPRAGIIFAVILVVLAGLGAAAYTLGIFK